MKKIISFLLKNNSQKSKLKNSEHICFIIQQIDTAIALNFNFLSNITKAIIPTM